MIIENLKEYKTISRKLIRNHENVLYRLEKYTEENKSEWSEDDNEYVQNIYLSVNIELETLRRFMEIMDKGIVMSEEDKEIFVELMDVMISTAYDLNKNLPDYD